jgi:hypothetical protein
MILWTDGIGKIQMPEIASTIELIVPTWIIKFLLALAAKTFAVT